MIIHFSKLKREINDRNSCDFQARLRSPCVRGIRRRTWRSTHKNTTSRPVRQGESRLLSPIRLSSLPKVPWSAEMAAEESSSENQARFYSGSLVFTFSFLFLIFCFLLILTTVVFFQPLLVVKREFPYHRWEPIYIGTNQEPLYSELLTWEGQQDKMTQVLSSFDSFQKVANGSSRLSVLNPPWLWFGSFSRGRCILSFDVLLTVVKSRVISE